MVLVLVEMIAKASCVDELTKFFTERFPETLAFGGCRDIAAHLDADDGRTLMLVEHWDSKAEHQRYMAWRTETGVLGRLSELVEGVPKVRYFELI